jgi:hypothetical protein
LNGQHSIIKDDLCHWEAGRRIEDDYTETLHFLMGIVDERNERLGIIIISQVIMVVEWWW